MDPTRDGSRTIPSRDMRVYQLGDVEGIWFGPPTQDKANLRFGKSLMASKHTTRKRNSSLNLQRSHGGTNGKLETCDEIHDIECMNHTPPPSAPLRSINRQQGR